jgi:hypothetical protein
LTRIRFSLLNLLNTDTLLVLFNAALANLVCFGLRTLRTVLTFARCCSVTISPFLGTLQILSRSGVSFANASLLIHSKSFQSSTKVLDPDANPSLFQSTLAIIIKVRII